MTKLKLSILGAIVVAGVVVPVAIMQHSPGPTSPEGTPTSAQTEPRAEQTEPSTEATAAPKTGLVSQRSLPTAQNLLGLVATNTASFRSLDEILKGQRLSAEQAQALESKLVQDPEDLSARCQLLGYYSSKQYASKSAREARQGHVLWFIQHHPEIGMQGYAVLDPHLDGPAYGQAKALWLQQVTDNPQNLTILGNAAGFCLLHDRPTAEDLLQKAQASDPANPAWSGQLAQLYALEANSAKPGAANAAATKALEQMEDAQAKTTDAMGRFHNLNQLAQMAYDAGEIEKAQTYATALLQQTTQLQTGSDYGDAIYRGNLVLGRIALRKGQLEVAKQYLLASAKTTGSPVLGSFGPNMTLAKELLEQGEKETVLEYFNLCANFWKNDKLTAWSQQVNQGWLPDFGANLNY